jgi:hypothetical protein
MCDDGAVLTDADARKVEGKEASSHRKMQIEAKLESRVSVTEYLGDFKKQFIKLNS